MTTGWLCKDVKPVKRMDRWEGRIGIKGWDVEIEIVLWVTMIKKIVRKL